MTIDYATYGGKWAKHIHALAIIESGEDATKIGDGGRAFGLLQHHPEFFDEWWTPVVGQTWVEAQISATAHFFQHYAQNDLNLVIQAFNLGAYAVFIENKTNPQYLARWKQAFASLSSETP